MDNRYTQLPTDIMNTNNASITIKATLVNVEEHRLVSIPAAEGSSRFTCLVKKLQQAFSIGSRTFALTYTDDEGDKVSISSDGELSCALSLVPSGRLLRLFIAVQPEEQVINEESPQVVEDHELLQELATDPSTAASEEQRASVPELELAVALKTKLEKEFGIVITPDMPMAEKRCQRLVVRFNGDLDKAAQVMRKWNENRLARIESRKAENASAREARKQEKMAAHLARLQQRKELVKKEGDSDKPVKGLSKKAELGNLDELLEQLASKGFGADPSAEGKVVDRIKMRNTRLLKRFDGDVEQVVALLSAKRAAAEERLAERKARCAARRALKEGRNKPIAAQSAC